MQETRETIRAFLGKHIATDRLRDDDDLFAGGFVNSLFAMQLVLFVESAFALQIENENLRMENFRSINALGDLIEGKRLQARNQKGPHLFQ
ncbi:MAG: phosphopantetheine-binding protein [Thermodesulfobacteriota bacterium]|nr:phosphopantetheine-binding protein [Thermodesulfobacteriota bacterium]